MGAILSRIYIGVLILACIGLFAASPATRDYAVQAFNAGDAAYHFYDDFPTDAAKPLFLFQCFIAASLAFLFKASNRKRFENKRILECALYGLGAACILLWPSSAIVVTITLFVLGYFWNEQPSVSKRKWLLAALFILAFALRIEKLPNVYDRPLQPDSIQYLTYSQESTWFYDTNHREPAWAWVNWALTRVFPAPEDVSHGYPPVRITTILLSCLAVIAAYEFGRRWLTHQAGFVAALLMATNKALIYRSLQGLRLEILMLGIFALLWFAWSQTRTKKPFDVMTLGLGLSGALLLLLRTSCLPIVLFSLFWAFWSGKQSWKQIAVAGTICLIPVLPYYIYCHGKYGDPLYSGNAHIRFYYNAVFGEYPTERVSPFQFMFKLFKWHQTILYSIAGTLDAFLGRYALRLFYLPLSAALIGCSAIGYFRWLVRPDRRLLAFCVLLLLGPMAFFMGILIHSKTVFDWRLVAHLFPFMAYAAVEGFTALMGWAKIYDLKQDSKESSESGCPG